MSSREADRNLLFGVLALQADAITRAQFVEACTLWASQKDRTLADLMVERGWLAPADRDDVSRLVERKLKKHAGDARAGLAEVTGDAVRVSLAEVPDLDVRESLGLSVGAHGTHLLVSTMGHESGSRDRYTLTRLHAEGGLGRVWLARDESLGREVALKELRPERASHPTVWARFLEEARITGQLEHPNIVPVHELKGPAAGDTAGKERSPFYTMRFVKGRTLSEASRAYHARRRDGQAGPLELRELLQAFVGVCQALAYAHSRGVIHRDLKGQNVVLGDFGEVIVLDWGLAKVVGRHDETMTPPLDVEHPEGRGETLQGQALGTPAYMSPEQAEGRWDQVDCRTDVYGLGAILYEILCGQPPFDGPDTAAVLRHVVQDPPVRPRSVCDAVPAALEAVCLKALEKKPEDRYPLSAALADEIKHWMADEPVSAYREPLATRAGRWARRHRTAVACAAMLLVTAVVALSVSTVLINQERARAERSFRQARQAVDDYFTTVSESKLLDVPGLQPLRKELLDAALKYYQGFLREREGDSAVRRELGATLYRVGFITDMIGSRSEALRTFERARGIQAEFVRDEPRSPEARAALADTFWHTGDIRRWIGQNEASLADHREALAVLETLNREHPGGTRFEAALGRSEIAVAELLQVTERPLEGLNLARKAYVRLERLAREHPGRDDIRHYLALAARQLGSLLSLLRKPDEAIAVQFRGVEILEGLMREQPRVIRYRSDLGFAYYYLASALLSAGRSEEGRRFHQRAFDLREILLRENPAIVQCLHEMASSESTLGLMDQYAGAPDSGIAHLIRAVALERQVVQGNPDNLGYRGTLASALHNLAIVRRGKGQVAEALDLFQQALELKQGVAEASPGESSLTTTLALTWIDLGITHRLLGRPKEAQADLSRAVEILERLREPTPLVLYNMACAHSQLSALAGIEVERTTPEQRAEQDREAAQAVTLLRRATEAGFKDLARFHKEADLDPLRSRDDFHALMAELERGVTKAP